jgi:sugar transferase EpsL
MDRRIKRLLDVSAGTIGLILLAPLFLLIAMIIRLTMGSPVLFRQPRLGYKCCPFVLVKFRTMSNKLDRYGNLLPDSQRLTTLGRLMRRSSLDEFPQLWNVLKGEMSLVGPRPLFLKYEDLYTPEQKRRHEVKPGITGWAQIKGRNVLSWEKKFDLDVWYVDHRNLFLDARILLNTFWQVFEGSGISQEGHVTMPEFTGSKKKHDRATKQLTLPI